MLMESDGRVRRTALLVLALMVLLVSGPAQAHSVLTHEQVVDLLWDDNIRPLLAQRFPGLTEDQMRQAHAYAYGGAVIQDLGYYPFGSVQFSNLVHYVRTGDFVLELLRQSRDVNEYAFALGALSHYASDSSGHPAVNQAVALQYPKLRARYGNSVRYAEDKSAHLKTEFGFDMLQVARNRYASEQYHDFIGFQVSKPLLIRVFPIVYGVEFKDVLTREDLAIGSYRFSVSQLIPKMTQVALQLHKQELKETSNFAKRKFLYRLSRSEYEREWGKDYVKPGLGTRFLSTLLRFMPKVGPFRALGFNSPTAQTEDLYIKSINTTVDRYRGFLEGVRTQSLVLPNLELDSGRATAAGDYSLADETYGKLLDQLSGQNFVLTSTELRANILEFYSDPASPIAAKKDVGHWRGTLASIEELKAHTPKLAEPGTPAAAGAPSPTPTPRPAIVVGFVGGFIKHDNLAHSEVQLAARLRQAYPVGVSVETFESYRGARAREWVLGILDQDQDGSLSPREKQDARVIIYGHSWGGSEAITLARELGKDGISILLTIQVDSVGKRGQDDAAIPPNVVKAANFFQSQGWLHGQPAIRAADPSRTSIVGNFEFDYRGKPYRCAGFPWYNRIFSKAHTQIECDSSVWKQAESLIHADLAPGQALLSLPVVDLGRI